MLYRLNSNLPSRHRQRGAITMFSAVLILILLTEMIIYAVQVGVFEQRKSSNEMQQKIAFHTADSALQQAKEFLRINNRLIAAADDEVLPIVDADGDIIGWRPGWLAAGSNHWVPCQGNYSDADRSHPCWAEPVEDLRDASYFYTQDGTSDGSTSLIDNSVIGGDGFTNVTLQALLCMLEVDEDADPAVQGCAGVGNEDLQDSRYFMVTILSRGEAECDGAGANCIAEALISEKVGSFGPGDGEGGPGAPLTTKSTLPESGDTDIVPNPNGGGVGVPISVWIDDSVDIEGFGGSWTTCEAHEWYGVDIMPNDYRCPSPGNCTCDGKKQLSYSLPGANEQFLNFDMVPDPNFPDDLFYFIFRQPGDEDGVEAVKEIADFVIPGDEYSDCSELGTGAYGLIIVENDCDLSGNALIGSGKAPVFLVLLGADNSMGGTIEIFGTVMLTDSINSPAEIGGNGNVTIYGALIADGDLSKFGGNLKLVYVDDIIRQTTEYGGFGAVAGGWTDFHPDWR